MTNILIGGMTVGLLHLTGGMGGGPAATGVTYGERPSVVEFGGASSVGTGGK